MNKVIGMALLIAGLALIGYGFNAPDPANPEVAHTFARITAGKGLWLVLGGSAAVVVGEAMIFHRSGKA